MTKKAKATKEQQVRDRIRHDDTVVMTSLNPRWAGFARRLRKAIRAEGCDATSLRLSKGILAGLTGIDVARSVAFFQANGGYCDCEVLLNVGQ
jgi:hypothetical protein